MYFNSSYYYLYSKCKHFTVVILEQNNPVKRLQTKSLLKNDMEKKDL